jgi:quercetin dioxygenase-like cupin family protein
MNIRDLIPHEKSVSTEVLFKSEHGAATAIQILQGQQLKEHVSKVPALLICILGKVVFENEKGEKETLLPGDYVSIDPMVKHWINAVSDSQLILFK